MSDWTPRQTQPRGWVLGPFLGALATSMVLALPWRLFGLAPPALAPFLVPMFAWSLIGPNTWTPLVLVAGGVVLDALGGGRFGVWPLALLAGFLATRPFRLAVAAIGWPLGAGVWALATAVALLAGWLGSGVSASALPDFAPSLAAWAFNLLLFPLAWRLSVWSGLEKSIR
jgi:rod shape-determining protein MreD